MWDVIVAGGGVSGCIAALAAARGGAKTLLIERYGFLGGTLTNAGVGPMMTFHAGERQVVGGIAQELIDRLIERRACLGHIRDTTGYVFTVTPFDAEQLKFVLDQMMQESGVEVLLHTMLAKASARDGLLRAVTVCNKAGLTQLEGRIFVDATGDGDLACFAGACVKMGRDEDGLCQPMTTNMKLGGVDVGRIRAEIRRNPDNFNVKDLSLLEKTPRLSMAGFYREFDAAKAAGEISTPREDVLLFETVNPGEVIINTTRVLRLSATDPWQLSQAEREGRKQAHELFAFFKKRCAGFEDAVFLSTGVQIGVRESRRVMGRYLLTAEDILSPQGLADAIALGGYPIDIHNPAGAATHTTHLRQGQHYAIPYGCLVAQSPKNLLVSGRCLSATHEAGAAVRVTPIAMATGQAAGAAAALCIREGCLPGQVDIRTLRKHLACGRAILE